MTKKITAAVVDKKGGQFHIRHDVNLAPMQDDDLLVHMVASGICHSDEGLRNGSMPVGYPIILGHEGAGIIEKVGPKVKSFKPGDHVVLTFYSCGHCHHCLTGNPTQCIHFADNVSGVRPDGSAHFTENGHKVCDMFDQSSFTTETVVNERNAVKVSKDIDLRKVGPLGCGYMTGSGTVFNTLKPRPDQSIAVLGTGAVGLAAMMAARVCGCTTIIAIDIHDSRLQLAKKLGATNIINDGKTDMNKAIKKITNGNGVDYVIDTTGIAPLVEKAIKMLASGGTIVPIAMTSHNISVDTWYDLCNRDQSIVGVAMGDGIPQIDIPRLIHLYQAGMFDFDKTEKFYPFSKINQANADSVSGKTIKPVLIIDKNYKPNK